MAQVVLGGLPVHRWSPIQVVTNCPIISPTPHRYLPSSVVRYLRYFDKCCEYQRFDTSIKEVLIYRDISRCHDTAKCCDDTFFDTNHCRTSEC